MYVTVASSYTTDFPDWDKARSPGLAELQWWRGREQLGGQCWSRSPFPQAHFRITMRNKLASQTYNVQVPDTGPGSLNARP